MTITPEQIANLRRLQKAAIFGHWVNQGPLSRENADFARAAYAAIPALLDELERLQAMRAERAARAANRRSVIRDETDRAGVEEYDSGRFR